MQNFLNNLRMTDIMFHTIGLLFIILIFCSSLVISMNQMSPKKEGYNEQTGQFCLSCKDKTINQCLNCFNCGFCVDKWGNSRCVGGDHKGPYNFEKCAYWYHNDPYSVMMQRDQNYKVSYGPRSCNRII